MTDLANMAAVLVFAVQRRDRGDALALVDSIEIGVSVHLLEGLANEPGAEA